MEVTITVSEPFTKIAGGWTGMRPVGQARTYTANVAGVDYVNTRKAEIQRVIRAAIYRAETDAKFVHVPVSFKFVSESERNA